MILYIRSGFDTGVRSNDAGDFVSNTLSFMLKFETL